MISSSKYLLFDFVESNAVGFSHQIRCSLLQQIRDFKEQSQKLKSDDTDGGRDPNDYQPWKNKGASAQTSIYSSANCQVAPAVVDVGSLLDALVVTCCIILNESPPQLKVCAFLVFISS
jgi:hypothetical protein